MVSALLQACHGLEWPGALDNQVLVDHLAEIQILKISQDAMLAMLPKKNVNDIVNLNLKPTGIDEKTHLFASVL